MFVTMVVNIWVTKHVYRMTAHRLIHRHDTDHVINDEHSRTIIVVLAKHEIAP